MNLVRVVPLLLALSAPAARAEEACQVDPKVFKPQFIAKLPRGFKLVSTAKDKKTKEIKQVLKLADGYEATVTVGGCSHLTFTIGLKGPGLTTKTVGSELVQICKRVLPTLPMEKDATVDPALMLHAIDEARISVMPAQLPCGEATCQLSLVPDDVKPAKAPPRPKKKDPKDKKDEPPADPIGILTLSYDLPL